MMRANAEEFCHRWREIVIKFHTWNQFQALLLVSQRKGFYFEKMGEEVIIEKESNQHDIIDDEIASKALHYISCERKARSVKMVLIGKLNSRFGGAFRSSFKLSSVPFKRKLPQSLPNRLRTWKPEQFKWVRHLKFKLIRRRAKCLSPLSAFRFHRRFHRLIEPIST